MNLDLHMHSTNSDGTKTPEELFQRAKGKKLDIISITDHDTLEGIDENIDLSKKYGINYIPGIELSAQDYKRDRKCHLVGLNVKKGYKPLDDIVDYIQEQRHNI